METISLKMERSLLKEIDSKLKSNRYSTRTEFIRDSIRAKLTDLEKQEALRKIRQNLGALKGRAKINDDRKVREIVSKELLKKYGFGSE